MSRKKSERELEQIQKNLEYSIDELRVFVADVLPKQCCKRGNMEDRMLELESLVNTYGGVIILKHIQKRGIPDYNTYIGSGKLEEIMQEMKLQNSNLLIIGNILKAHQIYKINNKLKEIGAKAWDRVDLILKIFEKNAKSIESKLQIELAAINHMGPRIFGMGMDLSRQGGGSKLARGKGETNTEIMKRHLAKMEESIKKELNKFKKVRAEHRKGRERKGFFTIGIVGYTNAGKSSLLNSLTKKGVLAENKLFATLGTSVGELFIKPDEIKEEIKLRFNLGEYEGIKLLLNDTIGFIRDLPPSLIDAFSSTLEDSIESDLILHVVDSSDSKIDEKIKVVDDILLQIGASQNKLYVFNKIDSLKNLEQEEIKSRFLDFNPIFVSAYKKLGFDELKEKILEKL